MFSWFDADTNLTRRTYSYFLLALYIQNKILAGNQITVQYKIQFLMFVDDITQ